MLGLATEVIVCVLPFIGNDPDAVIAVFELSTAVTSDAAFNLNATVLPAVKPDAGSTPKVKYLVWPALTPKLRLLKVITPPEIEEN